MTCGKEQAIGRGHGTQLICINTLFAELIARGESSYEYLMGQVDWRRQKQRSSG